MLRQLSGWGELGKADEQTFQTLLQGEGEAESSADDSVEVCRCRSSACYKDR